MSGRLPAITLPAMDVPVYVGVAVGPPGRETTVLQALVVTGGPPRLRVGLPPVPHPTTPASSASVPKMTGMEPRSFTLSKLSDARCCRLRLAVRLGERGKVGAAQEVAQVAGQLFAGEVGGHCRVQRFGAQQHGDGPRGALAQERRCVRAAVDQTEVLPRAGVLATGRPAAYGGCFEVLGRSIVVERCADCLLYTSPSPRDRQKSRMPSSA